MRRPAPAAGTVTDHDDPSHGTVSASHESLRPGRGRHGGPGGTGPPRARWLDRGNDPGQPTVLRAGH